MQGFFDSEVTLSIKNYITHSEFQKLISFFKTFALKKHQITVYTCYSIILDLLDILLISL